MSNPVVTKAERENALEYALESLSIEGLTLDAHGQMMLAKFVEGQTTAAKLKEQILAEALGRQRRHYTGCGYGDE